ncbi:MAG: LbtU family siderophore porin [Desulfamplus sp.]
MKTKSWTVIYLFALFSFFCSVTLYAQEVENISVTERLNKIEDQLKEKSLAEKWSERIKLSGTIEAEAAYENISYDDSDAEDEENSDIVLSTVELGVDVDITEHVKGNMLFLYEDDEDVVIDEAFILLEGGESIPLSLKAGKIYIPFGKFESNMISDPLTLELAETRETAVEAGFTLNGFYGSAYIFNGDVDTDNDSENVDNYGVNFGCTIENDGFGIDIGLGYINNLIDSNGWESLVEEKSTEAQDMGIDFSFVDCVPGLSAHTVLNIGQIKIIGEYTTMLDEPELNMSELVSGSLELTEIGPLIKNEKISAWNAEIGCTLDVIGKETTFGIGYQGTDNGEDIFPENRFIGAVSVNIFTDTTASLEYRHDKFANDDETDALTAQLAIEF